MSNPSITETPAIITKQAIIAPELRLEKICKHFSTLSALTEHVIFEQMGALSSDYQGGFWEYVELSNGGFFMYPEDEEFHISAPNDFEDTVNGEVAGMIACLYAYSQLSFKFERIFAEQYHKLYAYALEHEFADSILQAID